MAVSASAVAAESIDYGDFSDIPPGNVTYLDVIESSPFNDVLPLYREPSITGNLLDFDPFTFGATSSNGGTDLTDGQLNLSIQSESGSGITSFTISEGGDYSFTGVTPTAGTFASVSVGATVSILEVDGVTLLAPIDFFISNTFFNDYATLGGAPVTGLEEWSLDTVIDLTTYLPSGYVLGATLVEVAIDNQLSTTTTQGNQAAIAKKDFKIYTTVPEPGSLALLSLGGLLLARRRRNG